MEKEDWYIVGQITPIKESGLKVNHMEEGQRKSKNLTKVQKLKKWRITDITMMGFFKMD